MARTYLRQDQAAITIDIPDLPAFTSQLHGTSWATLEGGDIESEDTKTRPGGMIPQVNLGGPTTRNDATISRPYTAELHPYLQPLEVLAGRSIVTIKFVILQASGSTFAGHPGAVYSMGGVLKNVVRPNWDSNATGTAMLSLVIGMNVAASEG